MRTRRARPPDLRAIQALISHYAAQGLLLPRSEDDIRAHLGAFLVLAEKEKVLGCVALENYGAGLAEIRSLAVAPNAQGRWLGPRLVRCALAEARRRKMARVFAVTRAPALFRREGFALTTRFAVPEKIQRDCRACPKHSHCDLVALVAVVIPERIVLPVLDAAASPAGA